MNHSVRSYLERIPVDKMTELLESDLLKDNGVILQDVLDTLISRNIADSGRWLPYIHKLKEQQKQSAQ